MNFSGFYFVYILQLVDNSFYTGYTKDLNKRLTQHQRGEVDSTKHKLPVKMVYFEGCLLKSDALAREKFLKSTVGKQRLRKRLKNWMNNHRYLKAGSGFAFQSRP